jgi:hypothetical protein
MAHLFIPLEKYYGSPYTKLRGTPKIAFKKHESCMWDICMYWAWVWESGANFGAERQMELQAARGWKLMIFTPPMGSN